MLRLISSLTTSCTCTLLPFSDLDPSFCVCSYDTLHCFFLSNLPRVSSPLPVSRACLCSPPYTPRIDCTLLFSVTLYYSYPSHSCMTTVSISSHYFLYILLCIYVLYDNVTQFRLCSKEGAVAFDAVYFK